MARSVVGLDVGTHAVRAVEVSLGGDRPVVRRMGQVTLPPGAVEHGEVVDTVSVTQSIKQLWREAGFRSREVIVGVTNQKVVVRLADLPRADAEDLAGNLAFQVQELIPIPVDEAYLDARILQPETGTEEEPTMSVLLAAARRDMVGMLLDAVGDAGLTPALVDPGPFALVRALAEEASFDGSGRTDAIVSVGGGVSTVIVHTDGVPQFVRILPTGGLDATRAIAEDQDIDPLVAEDLKRRVGHDERDDVARAAEVAELHLDGIVDEVRGSLDFFLAQSPTATVDRILVTGGGSLLDDLPGRVADVMDVEVLRASAFSHVDVSVSGLTADQQARAADVMTTAVGLALAGAPLGEGERRMSLLPTSIEAARVERRQMIGAAAAVGGLAVILLGVWGLKGSQVSDAKRDADRAEARTAQLRSAIADLDEIAQLESDINERRDLVAVALTDDVAWTRLLQEVATVLPSDSWLVTLNGNASGRSLNFAGQGRDHTTSARFLLRMAEVGSVGGLWLPSSVESSNNPITQRVEFQSTAVLTPFARSDRLSQYGGSER